MASFPSISTGNSCADIQAFICKDPTGAKVHEVIIPSRKIAFGPGYACSVDDQQVSHIFQENNVLLIPRDIADDASHVINRRKPLREVKNNLTEYAHAFLKAQQANSRVADPAGVKGEEEAYFYTKSDGSFVLYMPSVKMLIENDAIANRSLSNDDLANATKVFVLTKYVQRLKEIYNTTRLAQSHLNSFINTLE